MNMRSRMAAISAVALFAALAFGISSPHAQKALPAAEVLASGSCVPAAATYKVITGGKIINATHFVNVPSTSIAFTQGGSKESCVIVSLSAEVNVTSNETMIMQAVLDGDTICQPSGNFFTSTSTQNNADRSMEYVCPSVKPGKHTIKMQFKSEGGADVEIDSRTMVVHHVQ